MTQRYLRSTLILHLSWNVPTNAGHRSRGYETKRAQVRVADRKPATLEAAIRAQGIDTDGFPYRIEKVEVEPAPLTPHQAAEDLRACMGAHPWFVSVGSTKKGILVYLQSRALHLASEVLGSEWKGYPLTLIESGSTSSTT